MPRLNNKDFTVEELERLLNLVDGFLDKRQIDGNDKYPVEDELREIIKGTTLGETLQEFHPIIWNFNFKLAMHPESFEQSEIIKNAMRSKEVMESIESRFKIIVYEELNWYQDRIKVFNIKGDSNILE